MTTALGFDYGAVRIGVAVGQSLTGTARPLLAIHRRQRPPDWQAIGQLIKEWQPEHLVVGVPRHADGSDNHITQEALDFATALQQRFQLPVATVDERLSSQEARERLAARTGNRRRQTPLDPMAAAVILESWLQQH